MTTPTNHTTSSLFDFGDLLQPSQSSLEQNSSIEDSNIFVSIGGEVSGHTRYSSSAVGDFNPDEKTDEAGENKNNTSVSALGTLEEESEIAEEEPFVRTQGPQNTATTPKDTGSSILKPSSYTLPSQKDSQKGPTLVVTTESEIDGKWNTGDSMSFGGADSSLGQKPFSPTVHTSNQTPHGFRSKISGSNVHDGFEPLEERTDEVAPRETLPEDEYNADRAAAWAIHLALIFFCGLVIFCTLLTFIVVRTYGFLTLVLMMLVITFCGFLACFVDSTILSKNPKLRPVRQKILKVVDDTRQMIEDEYQLFLRDWREEILMLTEGGENYAPETVLDSNGDMILNNSTKKKKRRKKSKVFKMVKPFLGLRKKLMKGKKGKKKEVTEATIEDGSLPSYEPPATVAGTV